MALLAQSPLSASGPASNPSPDDIARQKAVRPTAPGHLPAPAVAYRADIDGLRAVAVLAVVLFHAFPTSLPGGFVGVDIFFVISGYLIGSILLRGFSAQDLSIPQFYGRRIKRIFPALSLVLIAAYVFGWFNLLDDEYMALGKHLVAGAAFVSNFSLWGEAGYFDAAAETKPLLHLWSLGIEEQFYVVWPLLLFAGIRLRWNMLRLTVAIAAASFAANLYAAGHDPTADFYSPLARFWELMLGCALATLHLNRRAGRTATGTARHADVKAWAGMALIVAALALLRGDLAFPSWRALLPAGGAFLLIDAGMAARFNREFLASRPMVWLGLVSFPLYLWHWPLLVYARILEGGTPAWPVRAGLLAMAGVLAWATYRYAEKPIRKRGTALAERWKVGLLVLLMAVIALQGYTTYKRHGLSFRLAKSVAQFVNVDRNVASAWREGICFLGGKDGPDSFGAHCTDPGTGPLVFLWGDSHAAAFYPGLKAYRQGHARPRLAQYTASGCLPAIGSDAANPHCQAIQARALEILKKERPDRVILTGDWSEASLRIIPRTVAAIRNAGVKDLVLLGPVPRWPEFLPKVYWRYWRLHHEILPARSNFGLDPSTQAIDQAAQKLSTRLGIRYISAYRHLCNEKGCLTRIGAGKGDITTWDDAHLTPPASVRLVRELAPELLGFQDERIPLRTWAGHVQTSGVMADMNAAMSLH